MLIPSRGTCGRLPVSVGTSECTGGTGLYWWGLQPALGGAGRRPSAAARGIRHHPVPPALPRSKGGNHLPADAHRRSISWSPHGDQHAGLDPNGAPWRHLSGFHGEGGDVGKGRWWNPSLGFPKAVGNQKAPTKVVSPSQMINLPFRKRFWEGYGVNCDLVPSPWDLGVPGSALGSQIWGERRQDQVLASDGQNHGTPLPILR